jgi:hypothetical protein
MGLILSTASSWAPPNPKEQENYKTKKSKKNPFHWPLWLNINYKRHDLSRTDHDK